MTPTLLYDLAREILDYAAQAITESGLVVPERKAVVSGAIAAWDDCCPGQITSRVQRIYRADAFPAEATDVRSLGCDETTLAAVFTVEFTRCAPTPDDSGTPPTAQVLSANAQEVLLHALAVYRGVWCWATAHEEYAVVGGMDPLGPDGGCVGYAVSVTVDVGNVCPCVGIEGVDGAALLPGVVL